MLPGQEDELLGQMAELAAGWPVENKRGSTPIEWVKKYPNILRPGGASRHGGTESREQPGIRSGCPGSASTGP